MKEDKPINSHFVTKGLTRPWEIDDRRLIYYDFEKDEVSKRSSKFLFAKKGLLNQVEEFLFGKIVEDPLIKFRDKLKNNPQHKANEKEQKALALYFVSQIHRFEMRFESPFFSLVKLISDLKNTKALSLWMTKKCDFFNIHLNEKRYFLFPEFGCVFFFIDDVNKLRTPAQEDGSGGVWDVAVIGILFSPKKAFVIAPKKLQEIHGTEEKRRIAHTIYQGSVGYAGHTNKVVIPPELYFELNKDKGRVKEHIFNRRTQFEESVRRFFQR